METKKSNIIYIIITGIFSAALVNLGVVMIKEIRENRWLGILTIILGLLSFFFLFYLLQIKNNQDNIKELNEEINNIKKHEELREKLLNTIKDIIILENKKRK